MSKILKRPMFRIGGSTNDGIMSMTQPRKNYQEGSAREQRIIPRGEENVRLLEKFLGPGPSLSSDLGDLLISGGLNILSGRSAGRGTLGAVAESFKDPYAAFARARATEDALKRQIRIGAATQAITSEEARELAKLKYGMEAGKETEMRKKELMQQYTLNYTEADRFQNFLNKSKGIEATTGLSVSSAPFSLVFNKGKLQVPSVKNIPEGIYYDPKYNKYVKIKTGTFVIGDSIQELMKPVAQKQISPPPEYPPIASDSP